MFAYCENNPVNYKDYTGESATEALPWWTSVFVTAAAVEPTPFGEIIFALCVVVIGGVVAYEGESFVKDITEPVEVGNNSPSTDDSPKVEDPPQSVPEAGDEKDPSNPGKMQKEVDRGQAPREIDRVHGRHTDNGKPHIHFKDKTALNNDGTVHDKKMEYPDHQRRLKNG